MPELDKATRLHDAITDQLLDIMENGLIDEDREGNPIRDADGKPVRIPPTAAVIGQAIRWHAELKRRKADTSPMAAAVAAAAAAARAANTPLAPLSTDDDEATR